MKRESYSQAERDAFQTYVSVSNSSSMLGFDEFVKKYRELKKERKIQATLTKVQHAVKGLMPREWLDQLKDELQKQ